VGDAGGRRRVADQSGVAVETASTKWPDAAARGEAAHDRLSTPSRWEATSGPQEGGREALLDDDLARAGPPLRHRRAGAATRPAHRITLLAKA
jgi:hypothetical protein